MTAGLLLLLVVLATLFRTQTIFETRKSRLVVKSLGSLILLLLPLVAMQFNSDMGHKWRNYFYHGGFALSCVMMVSRHSEWERLWPLCLVWPMLPLVYTNDHLELWLSLVTVEFLLLFAYQELEQKAEYHKYGLLRLLVIFQFFVFEHLFLQARPAYAGEILAIILMFFYLAAFRRMIFGYKTKTLVWWLFILSYLEYGVIMFDKIILDTFGIGS